MLRYSVAFEAPATHHVEVTLRVPSVAGEFTLWMPTWAPGSYLIREFARNVRDLEATDGEGRSLSVTRIDKSSFSVAAIAGTDVIVTYRLFLMEMSVRTSYVADNQALLNGTSVFFAVEGREGEPIEVAVALPEGWDVDSGMRAVARAAHEVTFEADDYDHLIDSPIQVGEFERIEFDAAGRPHRLVVVGRGNHNLARLRDVMIPLIEINAALFGGLPYDDYLFILLNSTGGRGGLEHRNSSVLLSFGYGYTDERQWHDLTTLVTHEHFHVWNVKRIKPADFIPYDLCNETYTKLLWVSEGITAYYDELLTARAGVATGKTYLERLGEEITRYYQSPGCRAQDLEESSLTAWTRLYRADTDFANSGISYYHKGALVALLLDLEIRRRSRSSRSLDDLMRALFERHGSGESGFDTESFERLASEIAEHDLSSFFDYAVRGTGELDFDAALATVGLSLVREARAPDASVRDWVGLRIAENSCLVDGVDRGSVSSRAGLSALDEIIAVDGHRVTGATLMKRLSEWSGRDVTLTLFRDDELRTVTMSVPVSPFQVAKVAIMTSSTPELEEARAAWLGSASTSIASNRAATADGSRGVGA